jgi:hypothetical protein
MQIFGIRIGKKNKKIKNKKREKRKSQVQKASTLCTW